MFKFLNKFQRRAGESGGSAAASGMAFQHRVAAWFAVRILAEQDASNPLGLPAITTLTLIRCETGMPVDDVLIGTSASGFLFAQVKLTISLSRDSTSVFASVFHQFVHQYLACQREAGQAPWLRPLSRELDRLVLVTSSATPKAIRRDLAKVLDRVRALAPGQSLGDAAQNAGEQTVLEAVVGHINSYWTQRVGTEPLEAEVKQILALIHVQTLDVQKRGQHEQEAKDLLRSSVLLDPQQDDSAWARLTTECESFATERSGADRQGLQRVLLDSGFMLKAVRSYRSDIEKLLKVTETTLRQVAHLARIRIGSADIRIHRPSTDALRTAAGTGSLLVVGDPGAGKSGALYDFVGTREGEPPQGVVFLAADHLAASSLGQLRSELGLQHELADTLRNWPLREPGLLVIDALDAARGEAASGALRDLIRLVVEEKRWRVVASIRKFDLRYGYELRELFRRDGVSMTSVEFQEPGFAGLAHVNIPLMSDNELAQIAAQSPVLGRLIADAPPVLNTLLRVPFNVRLLAQVLDAGARPEDLTPIRTQLDLLEHYWQARVVRNDGLRDAREGILTKATQEMVRSRTLRVERSVLADPSSSSILAELLSCQVLVEGQQLPSARPDTSVLAFQHHVLFDYAAERLLLRGSPAVLVRRLVQDPETVLVLQPSLVLHFRHLWSIDTSRRTFWRFVIDIIREKEIPEIGKLIGPGVAVDFAEVVGDLEDLVSAVQGQDQAERRAAEEAAGYIVGALMVPSAAGRPIVGVDAGPWSQLAERLSQSLRVSLAYPVRSLLFLLTQQPDLLTNVQRDACGIAARNLLTFAWTALPRDSQLVILGIQAVCRTLESEPAQSIQLLQRAFETQHIATHGFEEMPWLAREIKRLVPVVPDFVAEVYRVAFGFHESSDEKTPLGHSRILAMTSNRRQDYQGALYELATRFAEFLRQAPAQATRALVASLEAEATTRRGSATERPVDYQFEFRGRLARFRSDNSAVWDAPGAARVHDSESMLSSFGSHLAALADHGDVSQLEQILDGCAENRNAILWRRLLAIGTRYPEVVGCRLKELAWAQPILATEDTSTPAGSFLTSLYPYLTVDERRSTEAAILSVADPSAAARTSERTRNRLLGCLPRDLIATDQARLLVRQLDDAGGPPPNTPPVSFGFRQVGRREEAYLVEEGVSLEAEPNRRILQMEKPVREFANTHLNSTPDSEEIEGIFPNLQALMAGLNNADEAGVHPRLRDRASMSLASACVRVAKQNSVGCEEGVGALTQTVLLTASENSDPLHRPEMDEKFDSFPSWSPAMRIEAAEGLTYLAASPACATRTVLEAVERLSRDQVPAVRFQVARNLTRLYRTAPDVMWRILESTCKGENRLAILQAVVIGPLNALGDKYMNRIVLLTKQILERTRGTDSEGSVAAACVGQLVRFFIWVGDQTCNDVLSSMIDDLDTNPGPAANITRFIRDPLTLGPVHPANPNQDAARLRTRDLVYRLLGAGIAALSKITSEQTRIPFEDWPEEKKERCQVLARLIEGVGMEVYFASGAYERGGANEKADETSIDPAVKQRFYEETASILDALADFGLLPSLTHHTLETLEFFIPVDPRGVFLRIGRALQASLAGGYQHEGMGVDLFVRIVERYLADHRLLLQQDEDCRRTLREALNIFVRAGWPAAGRLTYRLGEIFR